MYLRYMTAHVRVNTSITCYAGYFAVHLLRKYTTMLGFLPLASSKIPLLRSTAASLLSDFLVVRSGETKCQLRCRLVSFLLQARKSRYFVAPQLRCSLIFSLYARVKPNASFAVAWFPSSLQKSLLKVSLQKANKRVTTSVLFRAHTRNLSKYRSFRYSSAITGGTCRSLGPVTSVRCSKAIFQVHSIHPSQTGHFRRSELFLLPCP